MNPHAQEKRQYSRVILAAPLYVRTLDPQHRFSGICDTLDVGPRGALLRMPCELPRGTRLRLDVTHADRTAEAEVVSCERGGRRWWKVRVRLLWRDASFWGMKRMASDWERPTSEDQIWIG